MSRSEGPSSVPITVRTGHGNDADADAVVDGPVTAGGSHADAVHLPGLPAGGLALEPAAAGLVVTARVAGARAAGRPLHPGVRRLLRPGERVELQGASLGPTAGAAPADGTRAGTRAAAAGLLAQAAAGATPVAGLCLVVLTGPAAGTRLALRAEETLGRGRPATLRLPDGQASRRHARVRVEGGQATVEDLGSKNGVSVNGVRAERGPVPLRPGDELGLGETALALEDPFATTVRPVPAGADPREGAGAPQAGADPRGCGAPGGARRLTRGLTSPAAAAALLALAAALALAAS